MKILMGHYNHPLLVDAKLMVSKIYPIIGEHIAVNFVAIGYHSNNDLLGMPLTLALSSLVLKNELGDPHIIFY